MLENLKDIVATCACMQQLLEARTRRIRNFR